MLAEARTTTGIAFPAGLSLAAWMTILACVWAASIDTGGADSFNSAPETSDNEYRPVASVLAGDVDVDLKRAALLECVLLVVYRHVQQRGGSPR